jgi:glycosyltransferase involved in cell wall biosynthesis
MRILAITSKFSGVGYHRIMMPLVNMQKDYCMITDSLSEEIIDNNYDILVMNRMLTGISPAQLQEWQKKYGFKIVVDNDDYWELSPSHPLAYAYEVNNVPETIKAFIKIADICTCTHERLAEEISALNKSVEILPNALPYGEEQFQDNKIESDLVRLFWSGSGTHEKDIDILRNPMKKINFPIKTIIAGYNEGEKLVWGRMIDAFTKGLKLNPTIYNYNEVTKYMAAYADSDISLIPLVDSKFNAMKSNLKVLETAAKKNPAIVSHVNPYLNLPVQYVKKQTDWYKHMHQLVNDKQLREGLGQELYDFCNKHYNLHQINKQRFAIYNKLIGNAN